MQNSATLPADRKAFYDARAPFRPDESKRHYHTLIRNFFAFLIPPGARVLEIGCGLGDLLAAIKPSHGVGVDFSAGMIELARKRHPQLTFFRADVNDFQKAEQFDYIILSDVVNDLDDVQNTLEHLQRFAHPDTRIVINFYNTLWRPLLNAATAIGAKTPAPPQNWLSSLDVKNLLHLAGWETIKSESKILWPLNTLVLDEALNRWMAPWLKHFCLTIFLVARPRPRTTDRQLTCSVVIPARNEAGNIYAAVERTPEMGAGTEIIFVEGHSSDDTWAAIQCAIQKYPERKIKALRQTGKGKGNAVRDGFAIATGELLFILDADLTMPPEDLPKFYEAARNGTADFVNGVRLVYPMENEAMRFANMIGNKFFSLAFSWLLGQPTKDTLCGTKVLSRANYEKVAANRSYFGDFDPFGDFDLLFGASKLNLRIIDLPIRYRARTYGETNISRWKHGWVLLRMVMFAARRLKFLH